MGKAYSQDLRVRVLRALDQGLSKMTVHRTFGVSRSTIDDWLLLRSQSAGVTPKARPGRTTHRAIADLAQFEAFVTRHAGYTLKQIQAAWQAEHGQYLSEMTFSVMMRRIGWTRKKRVGFTKSEIAQSGKPFSPN